jgi:hypothetical protein
MDIRDVIEGNKTDIYFYPFSGSHFEIIEAITGQSNQPSLFIFCSFGGTQEEYDHWSINNPNACGLHSDVSHIENKLGLSKLVITEAIKLEDSEFDATLYHFDNSNPKTKLIFVKGEVFKFVEYLENKQINLLRLNLIISFVGGFGDSLKALVKKFYNATDAEDFPYKYLITQNGYSDEIKALFEDANSYNIEQSFFDSRGENYFFLFSNETVKRIFKLRSNPFLFL